jgi:endoglucanase
MAAVAAALTAFAVPTAANAANSTSNRLFTPPPPPGSLEQVASLLKSQQLQNAALVTKEVTTPQAVWFTGGTPQQVADSAATTMHEAAIERAIPTLVAYNLPYRDCGQYSAGGAADTAAYEAWIDGLAEGIGAGQAIVVLEPDGLGLVPNYTSTLDGSSNCHISPPPGVDLTADPGAAPTPENRFAQLQYAVTALSQHPGVSVYLDATHTAWQNVGESADRLLKAGVQGARGFFLNVSNYQYTPNLQQYGNWVSESLAYLTAAPGRSGNDCPNQYWNGGPANNWTGVALSNNGVWSDTATDPALNTAGINERYASLTAGLTPTAHFVIDTSRNGRGPWTPTVTYPDSQDWCNPPGRGLGDRPTLSTGDSLNDAKLWIKTPGQSDGQCNRGIAGSTTDPEWGGITDPAAGAWFPQQALQLAQLAVPPLLP